MFCIALLVVRVCWLWTGVLLLLCLRAFCVLRPCSCLSAVGVWRLRSSSRQHRLQHSVRHVFMQALFQPHLAATRLLGSDGHLSPVLAGRACRSCREGVVAPLRRLGQGCVAGGRPRTARASIPRLPSPLRWWSSALPEPHECVAVEISQCLGWELARSSSARLNHLMRLAIRGHQVAELGFALMSFRHRSTFGLSTSRCPLVLALVPTLSAGASPCYDPRVVPRSPTMRWRLGRPTLGSSRCSSGLAHSRRWG